MRRWAISLLGPALLLSRALCAAGHQGQLRVRVSWGHDAPQAAAYYIRLAPATAGVEVRQAAGFQLEPGEGLRDGAWQSTAGAGDVDGVELALGYPEQPLEKLQNLHIIWADLIAHSDADTARRLSLDSAFEPNSPRLTITMNPEGTRGFTVSVGQLLREKAMWIPSLHVFVAAGEPLMSFAEHQQELARWKGRRILDGVEQEAEATYEQYASRWEDMGSPSYVNPNQRGPGHIVCLTWDSAIPKFGIDRGAGAWNDYGNPDHFRFWFGFADLAQGITPAWKRQSLQDGLPVITTVLEADGVRYEVEQFAYPLHGPPAERRGDIPMVLLEKVTLTNLQTRARTVPVTMSHRREFPRYLDPTIVSIKRDGAMVWEDAGSRQALFSIQGIEGDIEWSGAQDYQREMKRMNATAFVHLPANGSREFEVKLPSPMVEPQDLPALLALHHETARAATVRFWSDYLNRGAQFRVPEKAVNDLFRANLWHALRLPRRHGGPEEGVPIDLPYSNFAYSQTGTPWPVNQAVYVDYMLYDLRGYHAIAAEELLAQFRNNQEYNGHVNGVANWLAYTPGMLYAVAKDYLLTRDRAALDKLLPYSLQSLDWCLEQIRNAAQRSGPAHGLVAGPLNDGTGQGIWAFNQAYLVAALESFGSMLEQIGHPRAQEALDAARTLRHATAQGFGAASARSPLVQLRDHTWIPYVPSEASHQGRILDQWYPTDVDTGTVHLLRLGAIAPHSEAADSLLNDHEDNLYLHGWGVANEPVYNPQGTAYLLRDDPKAAIHTFYSGMAAAFSHSVFEPVEHRWTHGQYFGPPSTDGSWFELYRNMLVREAENRTLLLAQATPRKWLEDGKKIEVQRAPTYYGDISFTIESRANAGTIVVTIELAGGRAPDALVVRLRHPQQRPMRSVTVNGRAWQDFDPQKEWVRIAPPDARRYVVAAAY